MGADDNDRTDGELIESFGAGDQQAFEALYHRYRKPLYGFLNSMLPRQGSLVDDLYQKTWLRAIRNLPSYRHNEKFLSWLFRISHNLAIDHLRRQSRVEEVEFVEETAGTSDRPPWLELSNAELGHALESAVAELPVGLREVFLLRQQGIAFKEIARIQNASINTVLGRMRYAVLRLRSALAEWTQG